MSDVEGVLVSSIYNGNRTEISTTSGLVCGDGLVITTGTTLLPFLYGPLRNRLRNLILSSTSLRTNRSFQEIEFHVYRENKSSRDGSEGERKPLISTRSRLVAVWKCPLLTESLNTAFRDWTIANASESKDESSRDAKEMATVLVFLECETGANKYSNVDIVSSLGNLLKNLIEPPLRGTPVEVISTPFGNQMFANSVSRGIISNVVGSQGCLVLTDARTVPGCEGGPILSVKNPRIQEERGRLIGLVSCPVTWWRGEWVGLTLGISLLPILKNLFQHHTNGFDSLKLTHYTTSGKYAPDLPLDEFVVLVQGEIAWGSGVVFDSRTVITCSHVLKGSTSVSVFWKTKRFPARVVYRTTDDLAYDLAVIRLKDETFTAGVEFSEGPVKPGDEVIAAGFPFFSEKEEPDLRPSVVRGCISRVHPCRLQTTCCIQSGYSGGPLLKNGKLLGIVICNVKDSTAGALYPHINFCIPSSAFKEILLTYSKTNNIECLKRLESKNNEVQSLWAIRNSKL